MDSTQLVRNIHFHAGDNRLKYQFNPSFNYEGGSQSYRTTQNNDIDFPTKKTTFTFQQANFSRGYNVGHKLIAESKIETNIGYMNTTFSTDPTTGITSSNTTVNLSATNKLAKSWNPFTPSIDAKFNLIITPDKDGSFNYSVKNLRHDGFQLMSYG